MVAEHLLPESQGVVALPPRRRHPRVSLPSAREGRPSVDPSYVNAAGVFLAGDETFEPERTLRAPASGPSTTGARGSESRPHSAACLVARTSAPRRAPKPSEQARAHLAES